jgi:formyltetrahydrofolate deformylase
MTHTLLIECPDEVGLVAKVTGELFRRELNIINNQEFVDHQSQFFFMRTEFEGQTDLEELLTSLKQQFSPQAKISFSKGDKKRIALFATQEPHCLGDILLSCIYGDMNAEVKVVIANHDTLRPLAESFQLPFHCKSHSGKSREAHEEEVLSILGQYTLDYIVLAKYMRVLSPQFVAHFPNRIINIHHSFLPAFIGAKPYQQAFERGVKIIGATAHFVTSDLDQGPIIAQNVIPIDHAYTPEDLARAGRNVEKITLSKALHLVFGDHVFVAGNKTVIFE